MPAKQKNTFRNDKESRGLYQTQIQTNATLTSFLTAVVVFFVGLLLASYQQFDETIKIPIALLIMSMFGFLYASLMYVNGAEQVSRGRWVPFQRHLFMGDVISEYLGVYLMILSIPLAVNVITTDALLRAITIISSLSGLAIYQFSHVSMIERHFQYSYKKISWLLLALGALLFGSQIHRLYFSLMSVIVIISLLLTTLFAMRQGNTGVANRD